MPVSRSSFSPLSRSARRSRLLRSASAATAALALLAGCSSATASQAAPAGTAAPSASPSTSDAASPMTVDNCGVEVTVDGPPQRIVAIKSSAIEMLLALGVGDRIVGTGFPDGPLPADLAADAPDLHQLSDKVPSAEVVLQTRPDLVYAGWESNLTAQGAGDRTTLAGLGVATYVSPSACKESAYQPHPLTFDGVFGEITQLGRLLGVPQAAADLVAKQRAELASITPDSRGLTALWYSSGDDVPYVGAGIGAPQMIMDAVGLTNIAAGVQDTWTSFSWEQVAKDDPDVIVLVDASWNTATSKMAKLAANPATARLSAVQHHRYLVVPFPGTEAGVRNVPVAMDLAKQLADL
ncbi:putative F420-0 ABC transporter substrate-binding protein [Actinotalea lenta]|uniref:putative F420-0 ABC transporter substrate-binding protein n=1 Tax=Actinotalea lenta TaxID=3064654 RepID=UPI00331302F8